MTNAIADGIHYFDIDNLPIGVRRVCTDASHAPSHPHDLTDIEHSHDFCELVMVTQGRAVHRLEGDSFPVTAGDVFVLQGRQRHYFHDRKNLDLINIMYDPAGMGFPESDLRKLPGYSALFLLEPTYRRHHRFASRLHLSRVALARVEGWVDEMECECAERSPGYDVVVRSKFLELLVYLSRAYTKSYSTEAHMLLRVGSVIGALEHHYQRDWRVSELLAIAHMSRSTLMRVFRRATGQTPIEYLISLRLQKSMEMLQAGDRAITDIAMSVGFNDSNYFARQFRRKTGKTPRQFRAEKP